MIVEEIVHYADFIQLKEEWNALLKRSGTDSVFLRHEWFDSWWRSHSENSDDKPQLRILVARNDKKKPVGIFPLYQCNALYRKIPVVKIGYLQSGLTPYINFILDGEKTAIIDRILVHLFETGGWDISVFNTFPTYSDIYPILLERLRVRKIKFGRHTGLNSPLIDTTGSWDDYLASRPLKFRKSLRNKLNRIKKTPEISIEKYSDPRKVLTFALPLVFEIAGNSWKAKEKHAFVDNEAYVSFYKLFTEATAPLGWVNIWLLKHDDKYIAHEYHLKYNNRIYPIGADFDERYREFSPGSVLEYTVIKSLFEDPEIQQYNTCAQDYRYLKNWTNTFIAHDNIEIFSHNAVPSLLHFMEYRLFPPMRNIQVLNVLKKKMEKKGLWPTK